MAEISSQQEVTNTSSSPRVKKTLTRATKFFIVLLFLSNLALALTVTVLLIDPGLIHSKECISLLTTMPPGKTLSQP